MGNNQIKENTLTVKELRNKYTNGSGQPISESTWHRWLRPLFNAGIIEPYTKTYTPKQIRAIYDLIGEP